jgi:hypothetical protein
MSLGDNGMDACRYTVSPARVVSGFGTIARVTAEIELADSSPGNGTLVSTGGNNGNIRD